MHLCRMCVLSYATMLRIDLEFSCYKVCYPCIYLSTMQRVNCIGLTLIQLCERRLTLRNTANGKKNMTYFSQFKMSFSAVSLLIGKAIGPIPSTSIRGSNGIFDAQPPTENEAMLQCSYTTSANFSMKDGASLTKNGINDVRFNILMG